jgi:hypothetical protein
VNAPPLPSNAFSPSARKTSPPSSANRFRAPGRHHPPPGYWQKVEAICRKYGILLVSDEVICGFGRLGEWFGFQHFGIKPDIVSMAKGLSSGYLPISATGVSSEIVEVLRASGEEFVHGYTYSGHPSQRRSRCAISDHGRRAPRRTHARGYRPLSPRFGRTARQPSAGR